MKKILSFLFGAILFFSCSQKEPADTIVINASIWTGNPDQPRAEAMAISGDSILAIGSVAEIEKLKGSNTAVIDADGKFIVPGFIDSHVHFLTGGFNLSSVQLRDASTPEVFINRFKEFATSTRPGRWIEGGDWDHENWGGTLPTKEWIDSVTADNPVFVNRLDGHMSLANSAAMKLAGISKATKDVAGGTIVRDKDGNPTGIFKDNAMALISNVIPPPDEEAEMKAVEAAMKYVASKGVTSVHHMDGNIDVLKKMSRDGKLIMRFYANMSLSNWEKLVERVDAEGRGDKWVKIGGLKGFVDGSLGSHTAAFHQPFKDVPTDSGFFVNTDEALYQWVSGADKAGLNVMVHAIGDRAIETQLAIFKRVAEENGDRDRRFRIEHAQHIARGDFKKFADQ
jgi:predicted amidohydrolase YtcJ